MDPGVQPAYESSPSNRDSDVSATPTAVNSPDTACFPQCAASSHTNNSTHSLSSSDDSSDDEDYKSPLQGWPQLASLMSKTPDLAAFPRFRDLNTKSLLYYQCQLTILRAKLQKLEHQDARDGKDWAQYADDLVESDSEQFKTMEKIRIVLEKYSKLYISPVPALADHSADKALLQYSKICALPDPEPFNMRTLRKWLRNEQCANFQVRGRDGLENTWGNVYEDPDAEAGGLWKQFFRLIWALICARMPSNGDLDLAATAPQTKVDGLTRWVAAEFIPFQRALQKKREERKQRNQDVELRAAPGGASVAPVKKEETLVSWSEKGALRVTSGISTLVACLLPVIAITVLSQLHGLRQLLICLAGFAVIFALGLIFLTQGTSSRTEIFAATAA